MSRHGISRRDFMRLGATAAVVGMAAGPRLLAAGEKADREPKDAPPKLDYRVLGRTGLKVTTVSMGCMVAPEGVIAKAYDLGLNLFDTAAGYKRGRNEEELGRVLSGGKREKVFICTKFPFDKADTLMKNLEISLRRLQTDHVDVVFTHGADNIGKIKDEHALSFFEKAKQSGKTRFVGTSTHTGMVEVLNGAVESKAYDVVMTTYNYAVPQDVRDAVARAAKAGVGIIAMKTQAPVAQLTNDGKKSKEAVPKFPGPTHGLSMHEAALKWVLDDTNVACAIPGMNSFDQLGQNVAVMGKRLGYLDRRRLERFGEATAAAYCTGCNACTGTCRHGVSIPGVRRSALYLNGYGAPDLARETYRALPSGAAACAACAECTARCVNGVALRALLVEAHRSLA